MSGFLQVTLPPGVNAQIGPDFSPIGSVYWYTLKSTNPNYDLMELKSLQDWVISKYSKAAPDVVDDSSFGGLTREYQVRVDPDKLVSYGLSLAQIEQQLTNSNANGGGSFIEQGSQQINVRAVGLIRNIQDIEKTVIKTQKGAAIKIKDIATVVQGPKIRLGQIGKAIHRDDGVVLDDNDVVEGIVFMRKGADTATTMDGIHAAVKKLNDHILPPGVKIVPYLDRDDLVHYTTHTVLHNLGEGMILVVIILLIFLGNVRGALIVSITIPFALLFASICLDLRHISANLLSLGALDFGMVVDGAVVMIENIVRHLNRPERDTAHSDGSHPRSRTRSAAARLLRHCHHHHRLSADFHAATSGREVVQAYGLDRGVCASRSADFFDADRPGARQSIFPLRRQGMEEPGHGLSDRCITAERSCWTIQKRKLTVGIAVLLFAFAMYLGFGGSIGSEFLPHLDEGAIWVRGTLAPSTGPTESARCRRCSARQILASFPEVPQVVNQIGRPDDGTDTTGFFDTEFFVDLLPKEKWRPVFHQNKDELIAAMDRELEKIPGVFWGFSQPISDNLEEAVSGVKGALAVKIYGDDLKTLEGKGDEIVPRCARFTGIEDLGLFRVLGQPNLNFEVDRDQAARFGINVSDVQDAIQTAVGGNALTQVFIGEQRYDLVLRYQPQYRDTREAIEQHPPRLALPANACPSHSSPNAASPTADPKSIAKPTPATWPSNSAFAAEILAAPSRKPSRKSMPHVKLPSRLHHRLGRRIRSQKRSQRRLMMVLPITIVAIFIILYTMFTSAKWAL